MLPHARRVVLAAVDQQAIAVAVLDAQRDLQAGKAIDEARARAVGLPDALRQQHQLAFGELVLVEGRIGQADRARLLFGEERHDLVQLAPALDLLWRRFLRPRVHARPALAQRRVRLGIQARSGPERLVVAVAVEDVVLGAIARLALARADQDQRPRLVLVGHVGLAAHARTPRADAHARRQPVAGQLRDVGEALADESQLLRFPAKAARAQRPAPREVRAHRLRVVEAGGAADDTRRPALHVSVEDHPSSLTWNSSSPPFRPSSSSALAPCPCSASSSTRKLSGPS